MKKQNQPVGLSSTFHVLSAPRRLLVVRYLAENNRTALLREMAEQVAAWEDNVLIENLSAQQIKRVYVSLHQTHLPILDEEGWIDFENDNDSIVLNLSAVQKLNEASGFIGHLTSDAETEKSSHISKYVPTTLIPIQVGLIAVCGATIVFWQGILQYTAFIALPVFISGLLFSMILNRPLTSPPEESVYEISMDYDNQTKSRDAGDFDVLEKRDEYTPSKQVEETEEPDNQSS